MVSGELNARLTEDIAADPVPVFRPGVYEIDDVSLAGESAAGAFATGNTNNGLYLAGR